MLFPLVEEKNNNMSVSNSVSPLFSILIANYNNGCYLQDALNSVMSQSYPNWEIIIVDDCSTDNSTDIYKELASDSRIHVYYNDVNSGAGYTKRRCAEEAHGEICGFVDPDDMLAVDDAISVMVQAHRENPDVSMVYSGYYAINEGREVIREVSGAELNGCSALETLSWPFRHFVTFKKAFYDRTSGVDPFMKRAVDYDMYYKLEEVGRVMHLDRILYYYRHNSNSISLNEGEYKSRVWHAYTCVEAMKRRGLTDERLMLFPIEDALKREFAKGVIHAKQSKTYQVGQFLTKPLLLLKKLFGG